MIIVSLSGGLGNQMFQYAAGRAVADHKGVELVADASFFSCYKLHPLRLDHMKCCSPIRYKSTAISYVLKYGIGLKILSFFSLFKFFHIEKSLIFDSSIHDVSNNTRLIGYFQSEKYFLNIRDELLSEFVPKGRLSYSELRLKDKIDETLSVSIHVRRGDYLLRRNSAHAICGKEYFEKSLAYLKNKFQESEEINVFVFSDDSDWCRANLNFNCSTVYVEGNADKPEVDMYLMSKCKHQIISNSTFSWWGAWLNTYDNKIIIAPKNWFSNSAMNSVDIIPDDWIVL